MIIFSLEALADDSHRRHFIDPSKSNNEYMEYAGFSLPGFESGKWYNDQGKPYQPSWQAYYDACDGDTLIEAMMINLIRHSHHSEIEIWSSNCESVKNKTIDWILHKIPCFAPRSWFELFLKMRPIGDNSPPHILKQHWLNENCADLMTAKIEGKLPQKHNIDFVFESDPQSIQMFRKHGIFTFDCNQGNQ